RFLIGLERFRLASAAVEREHQLRAQALSERVLGHEALQLADELGVAAPGQVLLDAVLEAGQAQLVQTGDRVLGEALVGEGGQRWPAPEREGLAQVPVRDELLEALHVDLALAS